MKIYTLTLDLKNDPQLIREYEQQHKKVWPEVIQAIKDSGIRNMQIYRHATRLFMVITADDDFSFERKDAADLANQKVQEWEALMWKFQEPLKDTGDGGKWVLMDKIFELSDN